MANVDDSTQDEEDLTTLDLLLTLEDDYNKCYKALLSTMDDCKKNNGEVTTADTNFNARMLVHSAFAYIEGAMSYLKFECLFAGEDDGGESPNPIEAAYIMDIEYRLADNGTIKERAARIPLKTNVSFAFSTYERLHHIPSIFDSSSEWFSAFGNAIKVRDRITHPKNPLDLEIMPEEVITTIKAVDGMVRTLREELTYAHPELKAKLEEN